MGLSTKLEGSTLYGVSMKHVSLVTVSFDDYPLTDLYADPLRSQLACQNSALILIMHYSRVMPLGGQQRYFTSTAVFVCEVLKLGISLSIALYDIQRTLPPSTPATVLFDQLYTSVFSGDGWKLAIPACLYTAQNSLQYLAISHLDAVHFQILYQLKILTTALFSVLILRRSISAKNWGALFLLMLGVIVVQLPSAGSSYADISFSDSSKFAFPRSLHEVGQVAQEAAGHLSKRAVALMRRSATYEGIDDDLGLVSTSMNFSLGSLAVLAATVLSGISSIVFEKMLKNSSNSTPTTVWTRNVQLSFYSLFPALLIGVVYKDGDAIARHGFFVGYNSVVWSAIGCQAIGGVLVAMCINWADSIAKNFATSISIIMSFLFSVWFFDFNVSINIQFAVGSLMVMAATYLYSSNQDPRSSRPPPIRIASFVSTKIDNGYTPSVESKNLLDPMDLLPVNQPNGLSTSRPSSPLRSLSRQGRTKRDN